MERPMFMSVLEGATRTIAFDQAEATHELGACCSSFRSNLYSLTQLDMTRSPP